MRTEDAIWDRALGFVEPAPEPGVGDLALRAVLAFHGPAMNGGPLHALEVVEEDGEPGVAAAVTGFRWLGLAAAADAVEWTAAAAAGADLEDLSVAEPLEVESDRRYVAAVPEDEVIASAFSAAYRRSPEAFAPPR